MYFLLSDEWAWSKHFLGLITFLNQLFVCFIRFSCSRNFHFQYWPGDIIFTKKKFITDFFLEISEVFRAAFAENTSIFEDDSWFINYDIIMGTKLKWLQTHFHVTVTNYNLLYIYKNISKIATMYLVKNFSHSFLFLHLVFYTQIFVKTKLLFGIISWQIFRLEKKVWTKKQLPQLKMHLFNDNVIC